MAQISTSQVLYAQMQSKMASYSTVAALCFLAWDVVITTDMEVFLMCPTMWTWSKPLYFITRYYSLLALIVVNTHRMTCLEWLVFEGISSLILEIVVELILVLRLYAMYAGNRLVIYTMLFVFFLAATIMITALGLSIPKIMVSPQCIEASLPIYMIVYTITSMLCQAFLFSLAIRKYSDTKQEGYGEIGLLYVLVKDGALAFILCAAAMLTNTVLFTIGPRTLAGMGFPWLLAVLGAVGPRLFLHVRSVYMRAVPMSVGSVDVSQDLYFAVQPDEDLDMQDSDEGAGSDDEEYYSHGRRESLTPLTSKTSKDSHRSREAWRGKSATSTIVSTRGTLGH